MVTSIEVSLDTVPYLISIGSDISCKLPEIIGDCKEVRDASSCYVITDENVAPIYLDNIISSLNDIFEQNQVIDSFILPAGEATKSFSYLEEILLWLSKCGADRHSLIVALGGGVVGDLSGFAASVYMRGISWVQIPTTLLAQIDSSVGGKTGINLTTGKNLVGSFYQPLAVISDTKMLGTLPERELIAGYAEGIKHALISDRDFYFETASNADKILNLQSGFVEKFIAGNCKIKADIVAEDEKESGRRKILNFGHSFGHAIESLCEYDTRRILHGEAVAIGMNLAFDLSCRLGLCNKDDVLHYTNHIKDIGMKSELKHIFTDGEITDKEFLEAMRKDKKNKRGKLSLILSEGIGNVVVSDQENETLILEVIRASLS